MESTTVAETTTRSIPATAIAATTLVLAREMDVVVRVDKVAATVDVVTAVVWMVATPAARRDGLVACMPS